MIEINKTDYLFIKPNFVKTSMQIINTIYYVYLHFAHDRILSALITRTIARQI